MAFQEQAEKQFGDRRRGGCVPDTIQEKSMTKRRINRKHVYKRRITEISSGEKLEQIKNHEKMKSDLKDIGCSLYSLAQKLKR